MSSVLPARLGLEAMALGGLGLIKLKPGPWFRALAGFGLAPAQARDGLLSKILIEHETSSKDLLHDKMPYDDGEL